MRHFGTPKQPRLKGHKCLGSRMKFEVYCECGWISCPHGGENARAHAYSEWRHHVRLNHAKTEGRANG
jgi:hypothetical protein